MIRDDLRPHLRKVLDAVDQLEQPVAREVLWLALEAVDPSCSTPWAEVEKRAAAKPKGASHRTSDELLELRSKAVLKVIDDRVQATKREVMADAKLSHAKATETLQHLLGKGTIAKVGKGALTRYRRAKP